MLSICFYTDSFTSHFPTWILYIFSLPTATGSWIITINMFTTKRQEDSVLCSAFQILEETFSAVHPYGMMSAMALSYTALFYVECINSPYPLC